MKNLVSILLIMLSSNMSAQSAAGTLSDRAEPRADDKEVLRKQAAADFRLVNQAYMDASRLKMDVNYTLFPSYTSTVPFEKSTGVYMKQGTNTYSNLLGIISLSNNKATVTLDSNEQTIVVADAPGKNQFDPDMVDLDTLLGICSSIEFKELDGLKYYKLRFDRVTFSEYNTIEVYIDSKTNFISRLTLFFRMAVDLDEEESKCSNEKPRLEIVYSGVTTSPEFAGDQFSETKYVALEGKNVKAATGYSKYKVINNKIR